MSFSKTGRNILLYPILLFQIGNYSPILKKLINKLRVIHGIIKSKDNFATELIKKYMILVIVVGSLYRRFNGMLKYDHYSGEFNVEVRSL